MDAQEAYIDATLPAGIRVTVDVGDKPKQIKPGFSSGGGDDDDDSGAAQPAGRCKHTRCQHTPCPPSYTPCAPHPAVITEQRCQPTRICAPVLNVGFVCKCAGYRGKAVSPAEPRERAGFYWGYTVRIAESIGNIFTESPFDGGYDLTIGTSERGTSSVCDPEFSLKPFRHMLLVLGGVAGLEEAVQSDEQLGVSGDQTGSLFDKWVNICPSQGSRTIRTEVSCCCKACPLAHRCSGGASDCTGLHATVHSSKLSAKVVQS